MHQNISLREIFFRKQTYFLVGVEICESDDTKNTDNNTDTTTNSLKIVKIKKKYGWLKVNTVFHAVDSTKADLLSVIHSLKLTRSKARLCVLLNS